MARTMIARTTMSCRMAHAPKEQHEKSRGNAPGFRHMENPGPVRAKHRACRIATHHSIPYVTLIIFDAILPQQPSILVLERLRLVMLRLSFQIQLRRPLIPRTDGKHSITKLPVEIT